MPRRTLLAVLTVTLLLAGLTGCSDAAPAPDPVARTLAAGARLREARARCPSPASRGRSHSNSWRTRRPASAGCIPVVRVARVRPGKDDEHATAVLTQRWTVPGTGAVWQYLTRASLVRAGERWRVRWTPAVVAPGLVAAERLVPTRVAPRRGRHPRRPATAPLVTERPVVRFGIDKTKVPAAQAVASARALARLLDIDAAAYAERV